MNCPKCSDKRYWKLGDQRAKCQACHYYFTPNKHKTKLNKKLLKKVMSEFLLEHSTNIILERVNVSKYKLLKMLTLLRITMTKDVSKVFSGKNEVDETYLVAR